jgi:GntR family transcriptional regulator, rspAB operon transcriptional repressor
MSEHKQGPAQRITDAVYAVLSERIIDGIYTPGQKLLVKDIAKQLQVSATPVKSALAILAREGLVQINPRSGTNVTPIDMRELADVLTVRQALEVLAAERAITNATANDLLALSELVERVQKATTVTEHYQFNATFHSKLIALSGNRTLLDMYGQLHAHLRVAFVHARSETWRERIELEAREHAAIVAALQARDVAAARAAVEAHCTRTAHALVGEIRELRETGGSGMAGQ